MADISRIRVDSTTYDLKDARLPAPGADGTGLVSVNGEWVQTPGYGYSVTEDSFVLGEFTSADFTQEGTEYKATIPLTSELLTLLQRMFTNHEEFNVTIDGTTYNSVADQFTYTDDPSIYLQDVFRLELNSNYTALTFFVPTAPSSARIYGSVTTYTQFDRRLLPEQELNVKNGTGNGSIVVSGNDEASFNKATGNHSVAEGYATIAGSSTSHTEGYYSMTVNGYTGYGSNSNANHSEGISTASVGHGSHSEGSSDYYVEHIYITGDENATELSYGFSTGATHQLDNRIIGAYLIYSGEDADLEGTFYRITGLDSSRQIIQVSQSHPAFSNASFRIIDNFAVGDGAHTEGEGTQAFRDSSHAEGLKTIANGEAQHAQGKYNIEDTNNTYAHIVGNGTNTARSNAHTLDWNGNAWYAGTVSAGTVANPAPVTNANDLATKAYVDANAGGDSPIVSGTGTGSARLLEGSNTASGTYSTAVGYGNMASDWYSYAEGRQNISDGQASHAEGAYTIAAGNFSHSEGRGNDPFTIRARSISDNNLTVYSINGASVGMYVSLGSDFSKITAVDTANDIVTLSDASWVPLYTDLNVMNTSAAGLCSHSEGYHTHANGDYSHAEGSSSSAIGHQSHAEGSITQAIGANSHSEGEATVANGESQHVQGKYNIEDTNGTYAHIVGNGTGSARSNAHTLDWSGNAWYAGTVSAGTVDSPATVTNANDLTTKSYVDTALANSGGPFENGTNGIISAKLRDFYYNSEWYRQTASGVGSFSSGSNTTASGKFSHAEGLGSTASGDASHAEGEATAQGYRSHAEGSATSIGAASHAEGFGRASGQGSHAEGTGQTGASAYASHAEGYGSRTTGQYSHAEGRSSIAKGESSHAEGLNGYSHGYYAHCEGTSGAPISITIDGGSGTEADPYTTQSSMSYLRAGQLVITDTGLYGWIESLNTVSRTLVIPDLTLNAGDVITVYRGVAFGYGSHTEGKETIAGDHNAHAEGDTTRALGQSSHAEGSYTQAVGAASHSEGSSCASYEANSHAEGSNTKTFGYYSHAEGQYGIATGNGSHVEGVNTSINYDYISFSANVSGNTYTTASSILVNQKLQVGCKLSSSVHGSDLYTVTAIDRTNSTVTFDSPLPDLSINYYIFCLAATGEGSHAEGMSVAIGKCSHAEGLNCYASGQYAHAEGLGTIANSNYQHVDGQYNVADSSGIGTYVHITGIGHSENDRKNGFTINNVGNGWFAGTITANGGSLTLHDSTGDVTVTAAQLRQLLAMLS